MTPPSALFYPFIISALHHRYHSQRTRGRPHSHIPNNLCIWQILSNLHYHFDPLSILMQNEKLTITCFTKLGWVDFKTDKCLIIYLWGWDESNNSTLACPALSFYFIFSTLVSFQPSQRYPRSYMHLWASYQ